MRELLLRGCSLVVGFCAAACVQHPTAGLDDEVPNTSTTKPWDTEVTISGAFVSTDPVIRIEAATDKDGTAWAQVVDTKPAGNVIDSPPFPRYYEWSASVRIPQPYWIAGTTSGFRAKLRASVVLNGVSMLLGTPENPASPALCWAYVNDPNAFAGIKTEVETRCAGDVPPSALVFAYRSTDFNDDCGDTNEACCLDGRSKCNSSGLICSPTNLCVAAPKPDAGVDAGAPKDAGTDTRQCTPGTVQTMTVGYQPTECQGGFTVKGIQRCTTQGKWEYYARLCNGSGSPNEPLGNECYCTAAGGDCGTPGATPCMWGNEASPCIPGSTCKDPGTGMALCYEQTPAPKCWKLADVKFPPPSGGGSGGASGGADGGAGGAGGKK